MSTERIETILNSVSHRVQELIPSERFYVVIYNQSNGECSFPLVKARDDGSTTGSGYWPTRPIKSESYLPDWVISNGESVLIEKDFSDHLRNKQIGYWPENAIPESWLAVPMTIGGQVSGALVVESWQASGALDHDDLRVLSTIARQTANAIENARLYEQLERKIKHLQLLNHVGQQLTKGLAKQENEILQLIYDSVTRIEVDTTNLYIVFYEPDPSDTMEKIYGHLRFVLAFDEGQPISIPDRAAGTGLTEYVIRTKASFNPPDVERAYQEIARDQIGKIPHSWLGVPIISDGQVFGVVVLRNNEFKKAYTQDDQDLLEILAGQSAIALHNLRLYEALQKETAQRISVEKTSVMSSMAAEFAHKMNNIAGTIPVRIGMARKELDAKNPKHKRIITQLDKVEREVTGLLQAAQEIREGIELSEPGVVERVNINRLLETAISRAKDTQKNVQNTVQTETIFQEDLAEIRVERNALLDSLTSIIKNGFEAIDQNGKVTVTTRTTDLGNRKAVEIVIADTGSGIPQSQLPKIFDLFFSTKGSQGLGFGLWRDKIFIKKLGGDIDVCSEVDRGSTFTITIPID